MLKDYQASKMFTMLRNGCAVAEQYSVSSKYRGLKLEVHIQQDTVELWYRSERMEVMPRLFGRNKEWVGLDVVSTQYLAEVAHRDERRSRHVNPSHASFRLRDVRRIRIRLARPKNGFEDSPNGQPITGQKESQSCHQYSLSFACVFTYFRPLTVSDQIHRVLFTPFLE